MAKEMLTVTAREFSELVGVDYNIAGSVLRFLVMKKHAREEAIRPSESGKGKGSKVYTLPKKVTITFE